MVFALREDFKVGNEIGWDYDERPSSFSFHSIQLFKWKCPTKVKRVMQARPFPLHLFSPGAKI